MHLGRLTAAFLLMLAAIGIALLVRSSTDRPERRSPEIGEASIQRFDDLTTGSPPREPASERDTGARGQTDGRPMATPKQGSSRTGPEN